MAEINSFSDKDYPGLHQAANRESLRSQTIYFQCLAWFLYLLIIGALINLIADASKAMALLSAMLFLASLSLSVLIAVKRFDRTWYSARAIAESVKTRTWRYMMRATPYPTDVPDVDARNRFLADLNEILKENRDVTKELCDESASRDAISQQMENVRQLDTKKRLLFYLENRILEQGKWYQQRARTNKSNGSKWFFGLVIFNGLAIFCAVLRAAYSDWTLLPTSVFAVGAASILSWMQAKRFTELSTSYALTAHEITIIRGRAQNILSEDELSKYVVDTESAFSREHTQWAARRGAYGA